MEFSGGFISVYLMVAFFLAGGIVTNARFIDNNRIDTPSRSNSYKADRESDATTQTMDNIRSTDDQYGYLFDYVENHEKQRLKRESMSQKGLHVGIDDNEEDRLSEACLLDIETKWHIPRSKLKARKVNVDADHSVTFEVLLPVTCLYSCLYNSLNLTDDDGLLDLEATAAYIESKVENKPDWLDVLPIVGKCSQNYYAYTWPIRGKVDYITLGSRSGYNKEECMAWFQFNNCIANGVVTEMNEVETQHFVES